MKPLSSEDISQRLASIQESLTPSARLVAVSKFHPASYVEMAYEAGQRIFGESRVQELVDKWERLRESYPDIIWHFIGPLQTNKVKYIAPFISMIESVTSERLLAEICRQAQRVGRTIPILLEVHVAEEETKSGFTPDEIRALVTRIHDEPDLYRGVALHGLMAMASHVEDEAKISEEFASVRRLFEELSMGMSGDYPLALREGATLIRIGSAIFGDRA